MCTFAQSNTHNSQDFAAQPRGWRTRGAGRGLWLSLARGARVGCGLSTLGGARGQRERIEQTAERECHVPSRPRPGAAGREGGHAGAPCLLLCSPRGAVYPGSSAGGAPRHSGSCGWRGPSPALARAGRRLPAGPRRGGACQVVGAGSAAGARWCVTTRRQRRPTRRGASSGRRGRSGSALAATPRRR